MRVSWRKWGVPAAAWVGVLALGGMALAGALSEESEAVATLEPAAVVEGMTLASGEALDITLTLQADPSSAYDLSVGYGGDGVGVCAEESAELETDEEGVASFVCAFSAVENHGAEDLAGTVVFSITRGEDSVEEVADATATLSVAPLVEEEEELDEVDTDEVETTDENGVVNHGHCVSYWAKDARAQGLQGRWFGGFISSIAQDPSAVAEKGDPGEDCDFQERLDEALEQQEADQEAFAQAKAERQEATKAGRGGPPPGKGPNNDAEGGETE